MKNSLPKSKLENLISAPKISIRMSESPRKMARARNAFLFLLAVTWPLGAASAQSQSSQQPQSQTQSQAQQKEESAGDVSKKTQKEKPKPKKVYTEEDLSSMRGGGVSVVGNATPPAAGPAGKKDPNGKAAENVVPMSGRDEGYWRGRAREILGKIAAADEAIARTKDDIKKYGSGGFDITTGMKDNVAYIEDRNGQLQTLEKRKTELEKQLDALQEEGRKAGAEPSWFR